ncbi:hypothetical protein MRX96_015952 [Rhipicephalus microplus]
MSVWGGSRVAHPRLFRAAGRPPPGHFAEIKEAPPIAPARRMVGGNKTLCRHLERVHVLGHPVFVWRESHLQWRKWGMGSSLPSGCERSAQHDAALCFTT